MKLCPSRGHLAVAGILAVLPMLLWSGLARATTVTFTVKNDRGIVLSDMEVAKDGRPAPMHDWPWERTDRANGRVTLEGVNAGDTIWVGRNITTLTDTQTGRPGRVQVNPDEPFQSIPIVIGVPEAEMDLVIPSLPFKPKEPELSDCERSLLGLINEERSRQGLQPLEAASTLSAAADGYAGYVEFGPPPTGSAHELLGDPGDRAQDMGFPVPHTYGENINWRLSPQDAFDGWMNSPPHRVNMLNPMYDTAGLGSQATAWVLMLGVIDEPALTAKAGASGDRGDVNAGAGPDARCFSWPSEERDRNTLRPSLDFTGVRQRGKWARLRLKADAVLAGRRAQVVIQRERPVCRRRGPGPERCMWQWRRVRPPRTLGLALRASQALRLRKPRDRFERIYVRASVRGFQLGDHRVLAARARMLIRLPSAK